MASRKVNINRAPVLTLWAAVVAERMGYDRDVALTLGKAVAGLNAQSKGRRLGIYEERQDEESAGEEEAKPKQRQIGKQATVTVLGRLVPVTQTKDGLRATVKGDPISPDSVERYLKGKFGNALDEVRAAMTALAEAYPPKQLAVKAYPLYEQFRPEIPEGVKGWGAAGELDLGLIRSLEDH